MHERPHSHELTAASAREWWLRAWLVLTAPSAVFASLRDDSPESAALRSEPVLLVVILAGMAFVLATPTAAHLMDDNDYSGCIVAVWAFLAGAFFGLVAYWLIGAVLYGAGRGARLAGVVPASASRARVRVRADRAVARCSGR